MTIIKNMIKNMIETYEQIYQVNKDTPFEVIVTNNIYTERLNYCHTESEQAGVKASEPELKSKRELLVLPDDQDRQFYLLMDEDLFDESNRYCQTIADEYTRAIDYFACQEKYMIKNLRADPIPDADCFHFLSEVRACYRGFSLFYNLTSVENKAVIFSYLCGMVPDYEKVLSHDLSDHMGSLAEFYGQRLAIGAYISFEMSLPDYLNRHPVHDLLALLDYNINNADIFENYDLISGAYNDFVSNKSKVPHVHTHQCNHSHEGSHKH